MNSQHDRDDALAAEYALGTLRGAARLRFQRRLTHEPALAARVARWQEMFSALDGQLKPVTPPESVWKKIQLNLPAEIAVRRTRVGLGWAIAAGLAAVMVFGWFATRPPELAPLLVLNDAQQHGQWVISADSRRQQLSITPLRPTSLAAQKSLQLWLIPNGQAPVSLGLVDNRAPTRIEVKDSIDASSVLAISLEPEGGSPTGQPTGPVLFSGKI